MAHPAEQFRRNLRGFWPQYRWLVLVFVAGVLCDGLSTTYFMTREAICLELHPLYRWASEHWGCVLGPAAGSLGKIVLGLAVCVYLRRQAAAILTATAIISFWAAWYNIWGIHNPYVMRLAVMIAQIR